MIILAPVSEGELLDKLSILYIKSEKIKDADKLKHVNREIKLLETIVSSHRIDQHVDYKHLMARLSVVNNDLWMYEDLIREYTKNKVFDESFIQTAKNIHITNDKRMRIKGIINTTYNSDIVEVKSYKE